MNIRHLIALPENLHYAWRKAQVLYRHYDGYTDFKELADFEINLSDNLEYIQKKILEGSYRTHKIRPLPRPKKMSGDVPLNRQYFHIDIFDQVTWIAIANAIGPRIDVDMPSWSYGNRLYRPIWYEEDKEGVKSKLEFGPYRHASGHLYKSFRHSWPLFRRHISISAKRMASAGEATKQIELDESEQIALIAGQRENLPYFDRSFWNKRDDSKDVYYASIDFSKFYPSISKEGIEHALLNYVPDLANDPELHSMLCGMLSFSVDHDEISNLTIKNSEPKFLKKRYDGIPTGLFVGGFLANLAMLPIDHSVVKQLQSNRRIAHFRFVDDHAFLAYSIDELCDWIEWYTELLGASNLGVKINPKKYDPPSLARYLKARNKSSTSKSHIGQLKRLREKVIEDTVIDGEKPNKLQTKTLSLVSKIGSTKFHTLADFDANTILQNLEWLIQADIPETEVRRDTRAAFAAGQINKLAPLAVGAREELRKAFDTLIDTSRQHAEVTRTQDSALQVKISSNRVTVLSENLHKKVDNQYAKLFELLLEALKSNPGKPSLFYQSINFCKTTGHKGLSKIFAWTVELREEKKGAWADYYAGLLLQLVSLNLISCTRILLDHASLHSKVLSAKSHLLDICRVSLHELFPIPNNLSWFHHQSIQMLSQCMEICRTELQYFEQHSDVFQALQKFDRGWSAAPRTQKVAPEWLHLTEQHFSRNYTPSNSWKSITSTWNSDFCDSKLLVLRRYPDHLSNEQWRAFVDKFRFSAGDDGWIREAIAGHPTRISEASNVAKRPFRNAVANLHSNSDTHIDLIEWVEFLRSQCDDFDPRASEWTALNIIMGLLTDPDPIKSPISDLENIHPRNILVPKQWKSPQKAGEYLSWDEWRSEFSAYGSPVLIEHSHMLNDYRYRPNDKIWNAGINWDGKLHGIGRILLGLICREFNTPPIWNIHGNEFAVPLPISRILEHSPCSSLTEEILASALGRKSSETRLIQKQPELFAWQHGVPPTDTTLDPDALTQSSSLLNAIEFAQSELRANQISVSMNQPRQLLPIEINRVQFEEGTDNVLQEGDF